MFTDPVNHRSNRTPVELFAVQAAALAAEFPLLVA
jgi:hypothetical protein